LVIEGGTDNSAPTIAHPALLIANLMPGGKRNIFYKGVQEKQLADRELIVPSGGVLGGGSSTNLMMYTRAQRSDFDSWKMPGWSADEMLPYLKKVVETVRIYIQYEPLLKEVYSSKPTTVPGQNTSMGTKDQSTSQAGPSAPYARRTISSQPPTRSAGPRSRTCKP
jgi:choline dehydrogenase-like flavoprotein